MYVPLMFLLIGLKCLAVEDSFFLHKGKVFKIAIVHVETFKNLKFNKRSSILEFAFIEGFMVIRISDNIFKLVDMPKRRRSNSRVDLLLEEEAKADEDLKYI
jgi:hypothetical protein